MRIAPVRGASTIAVAKAFGVPLSFFGVAANHAMRRPILMSYATARMSVRIPCPTGHIARTPAQVGCVVSLYSRRRAGKAAARGDVIRPKHR